MKLLSALKAASVLVWLAALLAASLFVGLMIATAGGAVYTPLYRAAAPFACDGELEIVSQRYSYRPGQSGVQHTMYCKDAATGARAEITLYAIFVAFLVYSGLTFAALLLVTSPLIIPARIVARRLKDVNPPDLSGWRGLTWRTSQRGPAWPGTTPRAHDATPPAHNTNPRSRSGDADAAGAAFRAARVVSDGREYSSADEMPPEARAAYERALGVLADSDRDGVPDIFENLTAAASAEDTAARLTKLKNLLDSGLITREEYESKRAQIISEL